MLARIPFAVATYQPRYRPRPGPGCVSISSKRTTQFLRRAQMLQPFRLRVFAFVILFGSFMIPVSRAQTAVDGAVGGTVVDASGAIVGGAKITVLENATNAERAGTADSSG